MPNMTAVLFGLLSVIFGFYVMLDYFREDGKLSITARTRLRIAIIFAVMAVLLTVLL